MKQSLVHVALVVRDYDEALEFFVGKLRFRLVEDSYQPEQDKRWVVVAPPGGAGAQLLLARASTPAQEAHIGNQTGGRVFLFLYTDDFWRDYESYRAKGVRFVREPSEQPHGVVAVFEDLYGNWWDLVQLRNSHTISDRTMASVNKQTVERYMDAFGALDHESVLHCLTDDVEWVIPGHAQLRGKAAFDAEIENPAFEGRPEIAVTRLVEEGDVVVAEGSVRTRMRGGEAISLVFCDVFLMRGGKIRQLTSYLVRVDG